MRSKGWLALALAFGLAQSLAAGVVTLTDGSSVSGNLKEQDNGDVIVVTGAGEIKVAKAQIRSIINDSDNAAPASPAKEGDFSYVNKVLARREKYGNEDGIPRTQNLQQRQISFSIGQLSYLGDALGSSSSDFNCVYYGMGMSRSFNDLSGWELWGGYGIGEKDYGSLGGGKVSVQRSDISFLPRLQKAINLGAAESPVMLIPHLGIGPVYSYVSTMAPGAFKGGSAVGGAFSAGLDLQFGSALIGLKYRYLFSQDTSGSLNSRNLSAGLPQLSMGWAF